MKIRSWTKKISAALVAGGLMMPVATYAANLGENLVVDGSFEDVFDSGQQFGRDPLDSWSDGIRVGGTYDNTEVSYDVGGPLSGGGDHYFRAANLENFTQYGTFAGDVAQRVDLSSGATGTAIAGGTASFNVSAYFTEGVAAEKRALGVVEVDFRDAGDASLGIQKIGPNELIHPHFTNWDGSEEWEQFAGVGVIPAGTDSVFISVYGVPFSFGPGDHDRDTFVDGNDFLIWQRDEVPQTDPACNLCGNPTPSDGSLAEWEANYGTTQEGGIRKTDFTTSPVTWGERNAYIDLVDFQVTSSAISAVRAVPEPASWTLLVTMAMGVTCGRRRAASTS